MDPKEVSLLIIDDEDLVRINLADFFEDEGLIVAFASSGEEGLQMIGETFFHLAIVDMRLPGIDGNTFVIEAHKIQPAMKYLIHTGSADYTLPKELESIGLSRSSVFYKPVVDMNSMRDSILDQLQ